MENQKAVEQYTKHLSRLRAYYQSHKEIINEAAKASFQKIKNDPEKYAAYKEKKRQDYLKKKQEKEKEKEIKEN